VLGVPGVTRPAGSGPRVAVVGAGAFGGWTALHLQRLGARVSLYDAWGPGNPRASSGGETRVIRAVYGPDRIYTEMVRRAYVHWRELQASVEEPLYVDTGALWMHHGDDGYVRSSAPILAELGFPLEKLDLADAKKRYPQIAFRGVTSVWIEHTAGALFAARACAAVRDAFVRAGGTYTTAEITNPSKVEADAVVFACGPWMSRLFPDVLGKAVRPTRQEVYYFGPPAGSTRYAAGNFPSGSTSGSGSSTASRTSVAGLQARRRYRGADFDPTWGDRTPARKGSPARGASWRSASPVAKAPCSTRGLPVREQPRREPDRRPSPRADERLAPRGGSGHGFKLGPAVGEMVAEAILSEKEVPALFRLSRLKNVERETQFERKGDRS
jgi:glycine/D-amino acid oxidase-like deaminating enzyme